jgi:uncharacterized protein YecT (DUF1311 family)
MKTLAFLTLMLVFAPASFSQTTLEMKEDASRAYGVSDKAMNTAYTELMGILNAEGKKRLKEAQRAWIAYRDAQAGFDCHHLAGGTMEGLEQIGALNLLTQERTKRLREDLARFKEIN